MVISGEISQVGTGGGRKEILKNLKMSLQHRMQEQNKLTYTSSRPQN